MTADTHGWRLQIVVFDTLVYDEVFDDRNERDRVWVDWCRMRYQQDQPAGCSIKTRGDIRHWAVPVGGKVDI
jgi:hypothetical protein